MAADALAAAMTVNPDRMTHGGLFIEWVDDAKTEFRAEQYLEVPTPIFGFGFVGMLSDRGDN